MQPMLWLYLLMWVVWLESRALGKAFLDASAELAIIDKRRAAANESEVMNIIGDVKGKMLYCPR